MTLNERIAKAKGWEIQEFSDLMSVKRMRVYVDREGEEHDERDWSGSIADAWELAEELPKPLIIVGPVDDPEIPDGNQWDVNCDGHYAKSGDIKEAICLAWLAVYEAQVNTPRNTR